MSLLSNGIDLLEVDEYNDCDGGGADQRISRLGGGGEVPHKMEAEKRIRREIANSNERRRMQSINAGFQSLRTLLPRHEGEKLSKAAILQQTAEYIYALEQEKTRLLSQNCQLKRLLNQHEGGDVPIKKRKQETIIPDCPIKETDDESIKPEPVAIIMATSSQNSPIENTATAIPAQSDLQDLRVQLDMERQMRKTLEEEVSLLKSSQVYNANLQNISQIRVVQYENTDIMESGDSLRDMVSVATVDDEDIFEEENRVLQTQVKEVIDREEGGSPVNMVIGSGEIIKEEVEVGEEEPSRLYLASTSRQNLETIVEAIRHLEGDHLFAEEQQHHHTQQELPLALTNKPDQRLLRVEMNDFLQFRTQSRPGVIVVKPS